MKFFAPTSKETTVSIATETAARQILSSDWDSNGTVSVHLPSFIAVKLLDSLGWTLREEGCWVSPQGKIVYGTDDALQFALVAEVL